MPLTGLMATATVAFIRRDKGDDKGEGVFLSVPFSHASEPSVSMGYGNPDAFRTEDALDPLRGREDFRLLIMDLAFPAEPFARVR